MPIFRETLDDVLNWHRSTGTPLHPVYIWAGGWLRRFSCRVCIFATNEDLRAIHENDPEAIGLVADLEKRINFSMRPNGQTLSQVLNLAA